MAVGETQTPPAVDVADGEPLSGLQTSSTAASLNKSETINKMEILQVDKKKPRSQFVYLTADSENVLEVVDPSCVYIVGGIVDRNHFSGITARRAADWSIQTARLPIKEHIELAGSKVLTVNQGDGSRG